MDYKYNLLLHQMDKVNDIKVFYNSHCYKFHRRKYLNAIKLLTDNGTYLNAFEMIQFYNKYNIELTHSANYYPQGNGLASNKILLTRIKRILAKNKRAWHTQLKYAILVDKILLKRGTRKIPYELVYIQKIFLPPYIEEHVLKLMIEEEGQLDLLQQILIKLV